MSGGGFCPRRNDLLKKLDSIDLVVKVEADKSQIEAILGCSSLTEVSLLAAKSARAMEPGVSLLCSLWILVNIVSNPLPSFISASFDT